MHGVLSTGGGAPQAILAAPRHCTPQMPRMPLLARHLFVVLACTHSSWACIQRCTEKVQKR